MPKASRSADSSNTRSRRRRQATVGAAGLAVVLAAGGIALAAGNADEPSTDDMAGRQQRAVPASAVASADAGDAAGATRSQAVPSQTKPAHTTPAKTTAERVRAAKEAGKEHGVPVTGPLLRTAADPGLDVRTNDWIVKKRQRIQVVYAHGDLTGQERLAWVADDGTPVGDASCTHNTRLSNDKAPKVRPNLLLCWRTSARKSVYTLTIDLDGHPSATESVAALDKQWDLMG